MMRKVEGLVFAVFYLCFHFYFIFSLAVLYLLRLIIFSFANTKVLDKCFGLRFVLSMLKGGRARYGFQNGPMVGIFQV